MNAREPPSRLIQGLGCEVVPVTDAKWGKGIYHAGLNHGDCFAYALARQRGCPLLFASDDFAKTDVTHAR